MAANTLGITHIVESHVEIAYAGTALGNVDTREQFGDADVSLQARSDFLKALQPAQYVLQRVLMRSDFLDLSDIADEDLAPQYFTDGLFTDRPGLALGLNPADCNAITLYDGKQGSALGLIHAGRQGVEGEIHLSALDHLRSRYGVATEDVRVHMAPSVRVGSYGFPSLPAEQLADPKWAKHIIPGDRGLHVDILGRIVQEYADADIDPSQITISPIDTGEDAAYFSHSRSVRTGEQCGRNAVAAMLRSQE